MSFVLKDPHLHSYFSHFIEINKNKIREYIGILKPVNGQGCA